MQKEKPTFDWFELCIINTLGFPFDEASLYELQRFSFRIQDEENIKAFPTAKLGQLTFNINRGENTQALDSFVSFLPYPGRYETLTQLNLVVNISKEAAADFAKFYPELNHTQKKAFDKVKKGLFDKARK